MRVQTICFTFLMILVSGFNGILLCGFAQFYRESHDRQTKEAYRVDRMVEVIAQMQHNLGRKEFETDRMYGMLDEMAAYARYLESRLKVGGTDYMDYDTWLHGRENGEPTPATAPGNSFQVFDNGPLPPGVELFDTTGDTPDESRVPATGSHVERQVEDRRLVRIGEIGRDPLLLGRGSEQGTGNEGCSLGQCDRPEDGEVQEEDQAARDRPLEPIRQPDHGPGLVPGQPAASATRR